MNDNINKNQKENKNFQKSEDNFNLDSLNKHIEYFEKKLKKVSSTLINNWEKYEDDKGIYYWHVPSGTIQREPPTTNGNLTDNRNSMIYYQEEDEKVDESNQLLQTFDEINKNLLFVVHSLGSTDFDEKLLNSELTSKAIQKNIIEMTTKGDNNAVRCWGKDYVKKLNLKIENSCIKLFDTPTNKILHVQPISSIKVWGFNGNNDFAYVARETNQKTFLDENNYDLDEISPTHSLLNKNKLKCFIFHCEDEIGNKEDISVAQKIAKIVKEELFKFKLSQQKDSQINVGFKNDNLSPFSLEEPKRTELVNYLGKISVDKPCGIDILNNSIEIVSNEGKESIVSLVHISPNNIIVENTNTSENIVECCVENLSFLGISKNNLTKCGFIMKNTENKFEAHIFECKPSSSSFCKIIEEACKIRYQKCLSSKKKKSDNKTETHNLNISIINSKKVDIKDKIINIFSKILNK